MSTVFEFERDFAGTLRCIPMAVRFKLDHCGVKLSLGQWSRFTRVERAELLERTCDAATVLAYRAYVVDLIETRSGEPAKLLAMDTDPSWSDPHRVPDSVRDQAESRSVAAPTPAQWAGLTPLQRFTLVKLTREGHDNANFIPAMREFALLGRENDTGGS